MKVNDVLDEICRRAHVSNYRDISVDKWSKCQQHSIQNFVMLDDNIVLDNDVDFMRFYDFLRNSIFNESKVIRLTTAKKIFNNAFFYM